jgi:DNA anti-recombination protein RmuC
MESAVVAAITKNWTPGGAGIWVLVALALLGWWKKLPEVLDAFSNRQSKIEERMGKLLEDATERFTRELAAADERHADCMEGQQKMVAEVERLRVRVAEQDQTIDSLHKQMIQMQVSAIRTDGQVASPMIDAAMNSLNRLTGGVE